MPGDGPGLAYRHLAPAAPARPPFPTVVLLHGRGVDENDLLDGLVPVLPPGCLYVGVRAPFPVAVGGYAWWTDLRPDGYPTPGAFGEALDRLTECLGGLPERLQADPERTVVAGFSQGAAVAAALCAAARVPAAGFAALSGLLPHFVAEAAAAAPRYAFVAHGTLDPVVPVAAGRAMRDRLARAGVEVTYREYPVGHTIAPEEAADLAAWVAARLA